MTLDNVETNNQRGNSRRVYRRKSKRSEGVQGATVPENRDFANSSPELINESRTVRQFHSKRSPSGQYYTQQTNRTNVQTSPRESPRNGKQSVVMNSSNCVLQSPSQINSNAVASIFSGSGYTSRQQESPPTSTYFAGSKFGGAPPPTILPPPPQQWLNELKTGGVAMSAGRLTSRDEFCMGLTSGLKILLHVQWPLEIPCIVCSALGLPSCGKIRHVTILQRIWISKL